MDTTGMYLLVVGLAIVILLLLLLVRSEIIHYHMIVLRKNLDILFTLVVSEAEHATSARELPKQERPTIEKFGEWADGPNGDPEKQEKPAERRDGYSGV